MGADSEDWKKGECVKESGGKGEERSEEGISFSYVGKGDRSFEKTRSCGGGGWREIGTGGKRKRKGK